MSKDTTYNGWTNYATWKINLEMFDGINPNDYWMMDRADIDQILPDLLKEYVDEWVQGNDFTIGLADAFLADVNWHEIAKHIIDGYVIPNVVE